MRLLHFLPGLLLHPMVRSRATYLFFGLMTLYFLVRWFYLFGTTGILRWYLTDLLFVPAMCTFALILIRWIKNDRFLRIHWSSVALQVITVSWYFEWYLPGQDIKYTADPLDTVMYICGGALFLLVQKRI